MPSTVPCVCIRLRRTGMIPLPWFSSNLDTVDLSLCTLCAWWFTTLTRTEPPMSQQPIFYDLGAADTVLRVLVRLLAAVIAGGLIGFEREEHRHFAGLRTHMLVSMGSAL